MGHRWKRCLQHEKQGEHGRQANEATNSIIERWEEAWESGEEYENQGGEWRVEDEYVEAVDSRQRTRQVPSGDVPRKVRRNQRHGLG